MGSVKSTHRKSRLWKLLRKYLKRVNQQLSMYGIYAEVRDSDGNKVA